MDLLCCFLTNCLGFLMAWAESHSLKYYGTAISNPVGFPSYFYKVYIDDLEVASYNGETRIFQSSLKGHVNADYWIDETSVRQHFQQVHKEQIDYVNSVLNLTQGQYHYQQKYVCTVDDDGNYGGYLEYAQNGKEFVVLDKYKNVYIPLTFKAEIITQFFNKRGAGYYCKKCIETDCPKLLDSYLKYASYELEKKVRPEVKVWGRRQSDNVTRLQCLVYGFHPRAVDVKWMRNGVDHVPSGEITPILPHPDGTYQTRVSVEVPTKEGDTYFCHVHHSSLEDVLPVKWERIYTRKKVYHLLKWRWLLLLLSSFILIGLGIVAFRFWNQHILSDRRHCGEPTVIIAMTADSRAWIHVSRVKKVQDCSQHKLLATDNESETDDRVSLEDIQKETGQDGDAIASTNLLENLPFNRLPHTDGVSPDFGN